MIPFSGERRQLTAGIDGGPPLRVLAVMDGYHITGPTRQLLAAAWHLRHSGTLTTLALFKRTPGPAPLSEEAERLDLPVVPVPDRFPGDFRTIFALAALAGAPATDILQTHGYKANVLAWLLASRVKKPWIAFVHGDTWENWKVRGYFKLERAAVRRADRVVAVSRALAERVAAQGVSPGKIRIIHNACLFDPPSETPRAWRLDTPPVVGVVGRLSPEKGVDVALRAHAGVVRRRPDARLVIAGDGPERSRLLKLAEQLRISGSIQWLGYQEDLRPLYRNLTVLLVPSRSEGMPNAVLEAMVHGLPVVATVVGGIPEVLSDGETGLLAQPEDPQALSEWILRLLDVPELRRDLGERARRDVRERFSLEARVAALAALYRETLAARAS